MGQKVSISKPTFFRKFMSSSEFIHVHPPFRHVSSMFLWPIWLRDPPQLYASRQVLPLPLLPGAPRYPLHTLGGGTASSYPNRELVSQGLMLREPQFCVLLLRHLWVFHHKAKWSSKHKLLGIRSGRNLNCHAEYKGKIFPVPKILSILLQQFLFLAFFAPCRDAPCQKSVSRSKMEAENVGFKTHLLPGVHGLTFGVGFLFLAGKVGTCQIQPQAAKNTVKLRTFRSSALI